MKNQIIVAMDNEIVDGIRLIAKLTASNQIYGYKIGSLWILDRGMDILKTVRDIINQYNSNQKVILDMQKWGTDIPDIIKKQVEKVAPYVDELICCPMGAGSESLKMFTKTCLENDVKPICVLEMTHPESSKYLGQGWYKMMLQDAVLCGVSSFVIPATKDVNENKQWLIEFYEKQLKTKFNKYATGFKVQGGQVKPMVDFGVSKFIVGRAIYETENPIKAIDDIYKEINEMLDMETLNVSELKRMR